MLGVGDGNPATETLCLSVHNDVTQSIWRCFADWGCQAKHFGHILLSLCPSNFIVQAYCPTGMDNVFQDESPN